MAFQFCDLNSPFDDENALSHLVDLQLQDGRETPTETTSKRPIGHGKISSQMRKGENNELWTTAEEQRLQSRRDAGDTWGNIAQMRSLVHPPRIWLY